VLDAGASDFWKCRKCEACDFRRARKWATAIGSGYASAMRTGRPKLPPEIKRKGRIMVCVSPAEKKTIEDAAALVPERSAVWARKVLLEAAAARLRNAAAAVTVAAEPAPQLPKA
jgi:hypothetical protein